MIEEENETEFAADEEPKRSGRWVDEIAWYLLVMGFIIILLSGLCFFLYKNKPLTYDDFSIDANTLGKYLLIAGLLCYVSGRGIHYFRKFKKFKQDE